MLQLIQNLRSDQPEVVTVPAPVLKAGHALIRVTHSCVSPGTERTAVEFAQKNLVQKAQARPDLVRQVVQKARNDGALSAAQAAMARLEQPLSLGYSAAGTLLEVATDLHGLTPSGRVAAAGAGYAVHAQIILVPGNLIVPIPDSVDLESASFIAIGAIALHGIRLAQPQVSECVGVIGLGVVGQITIQLLKAAGCRVVAMDLKPERVAVARLYADAVSQNPAEFADAVSRFSDNHGADTVIIAADSKNSEPVELAGTVARDRATIVAVGAVATDLPRRLYYQKELQFRVSRSYGPGRYDAAYEEKGQDYPFAYVRWTERRNMQAFLDLLAQNKVDMSRLVTHRFPIEKATSAYELITTASAKSFLGVVLTYPEQVPTETTIKLRSVDSLQKFREKVPSVSLIGAGAFARSVLIPAIKALPDVTLQGVCTASGLSSRSVADKFGFSFCTTNEAEILTDPRTNIVAIATRHHLHASQVIQALAAEKNVFVEKPLCLTEDELRDVSRSYFSVRDSVRLVVGYNRRFAPSIVKVKTFLRAVNEPLMMHYRVNAGFIKSDHWIQDRSQGGGRILGEVCHFVDLLTHLSGALPVRVLARAVPDNGKYRCDNISVMLEFANRSIGTIAYCANGDPSFPKERIEIFGGGVTAVIDDFKNLQLVRGRKSQTERSWLRKDKGHRGEWQAFASALKDGSEPIPYEETVVGMLTTFAIEKSLQTGGSVDIDTTGFLDSLRS